MNDNDNVLIDAHDGHDLVEPTFLLHGLGPFLSQDILAALRCSTPVALVHRVSSVHAV